MNHPRREIEEAIAAGDLRKLLVMSGMLHGHYCPYSAAGVKAGAFAMKELNTSSTGMEKLLAVVETNNCFSDGIQLITGCTFGNNALIFLDYGKTAFTLTRRNGEGIRLSVKGDRIAQERSEETAALFEKVVVRREGTEEEEKRQNRLWEELSFRVLEIPDDEVFDIQRVKVDIPSYARIFSSVTCSVCGESVMEPRIRMKDGKPICLGCSDHSYFRLTGNGMSLVAER